MVVEDDVNIGRLERELLAVHGLGSVAAYTGTEALAVFSRCPPDVVLLDCMLPEMDGFETCRRLRSGCGREVPIIMLTTLDSDSARKRGLDAGADAYFPKPFDPDEIISTIHMLLDANGERNDNDS